MEIKNPLKDPMGALSMLGVFILLLIVSVTALVGGLWLVGMVFPPVVEWVKKPFRALVA